MAVQERRQRVDHRREQHVDLVLLAEHQLAVVADHALDRIAAIDRAAPAAEVAHLLFAGLGREHDLARIDAQRGQQRQPEAVRRPDVEDARNADAQLRPRLWGQSRQVGMPCREQLLQRSDGHASPPPCAPSARASRLTSSTRPLGQVLPLMTRSQPASSGTLLQLRPAPPGTETSMKVRLQLTAHQRQIVSLTGGRAMGERRDRVETAEPAVASGASSDPTPARRRWRRPRPSADG